MAAPTARCTPARRRACVSGGVRAPLDDDALADQPREDGAPLGKATQDEPRPSRRRGGGSTAPRRRERSPTAFAAALRGRGHRGRCALAKVLLAGGADLTAHLQEWSPLLLATARRAPRSRPAPRSSTRPAAAAGGYAAGGGGGGGGADETRARGSRTSELPRGRPRRGRGRPSDRSSRRPPPTLPARAPAGAAPGGGGGGRAGSTRSTRPGRRRTPLFAGHEA